MMSSKTTRRVKLIAKDVFYLDVLKSMLGDGSSINVSPGEIGLNFPCGNYVPVPYEKGSLSDRLFDIVKTVFAEQISDIDPGDSAAVSDGSKNLVVIKLNGGYQFHIR